MAQLFHAKTWHIHVVSGCTFAKGWKTREEALRPKFIEGKGIAANGTNVYFSWRVTKTK